MVFYICVDVSHALFFEDFVDGYEYSCFFHFSEFFVDGCSEDAHGGTQPHICIDERGYVKPEASDFCIERMVVVFEIVFIEDLGECLGIGIHFDGFVGVDEPLFVSEVFVEEEEYHVACLSVERWIHGHFSEEVFEAWYYYGERSESVPEIIECEETSWRPLCALVFECDE